MSEQTAQEAEATGTNITVTWHDQKWVVPAADRWPPRVLHYVDRDKLTLALETLLGPDQYETWLDLNLPMAESAGLFEALASAVGLGGAGE